MMVMFGDLTEDLVTEILLRLPVIDLMRLKLVCKSLYSLITSSEFKAQHSLLLNREPYIILSVSRGIGIGTHMLSGGPTNRQLELEGLQFYSRCCCEGVLLVITRLDRNFALWNPATGDFKPIPLDLGKLYGQADDRGLCVDSFGCGFDSKTNEYKPFFVFNDGGMDSEDLYTEIQIYSFKMNKWKIIKSSGGIVSRARYCRGSAAYVYADGMSHWIGFSHLIGRDVIISFDISNEVIIITPFSDDIIRTYTYNFPFYSPPDCPYPLPFNESSFALVKRHRSPNRESYVFDNHDDVKRSTSFDITSFDVWVLGEYGNKDSWTKLFTIGPLHGIEHVLGFWNQTKVFVTDHKQYRIGRTSTAVYFSDGNLFLYDTVTRQAPLELQSIEPHAGVFTCRQRLFPIADGN